MTIVMARLNLTSRSIIGASSNLRERTLESQDEPYEVADEMPFITPQCIYRLSKNDAFPDWIFLR